MPLAPVSNSVIFKKLFREPDILTAFLKDLTGLDLDIRPEYIETEKRFAPPVGAVDIVLDIVVEDPTHRILIEIQRERYDYHYDRFLSYHQVATVELTRSYRDYRMGRTVYTIVWLTARSNDPLYQHSLITTSLCSVTNRSEELPIYPHRLFFLNPFYHSDQTRAGLDDWLQLVVESITNPQEPTLNYQREIIRKASGLSRVTVSRRKNGGLCSRRRGTKSTWSCVRSEAGEKAALRDAKKAKQSSPARSLVPCWQREWTTQRSRASRVSLPMRWRGLRRSNRSEGI